MNSSVFSRLVASAWESRFGVFVSRWTAVSNRYGSSTVAKVSPTVKTRARRKTKAVVRGRGLMSRSSPGSVCRAEHRTVQPARPIVDYGK